MEYMIVVDVCICVLIYVEDNDESKRVAIEHGFARREILHHYLVFPNRILVSV